MLDGLGWIQERQNSHEGANHLDVCLTHWDWDEIDTILQKTFSNAFPWMKLYELCERFHWSLLLLFELTIFQHWFEKWLGADQVPNHYLNQWWLIYWHTNASLGLNELKSGMPSYYCKKSHRREKMAARWHFHYDGIMKQGLWQQTSPIVNGLTHWGQMTHICITKLEHHELIGAKPSSEPVLEYCRLYPQEQRLIEISIKIQQTFLLMKIHFKMSSAKWCPFLSASMCLKP